MKVILNEDVKYLGEEGDVKNVSRGYARNFLLPRALVVPYNDATVAIFAAKKAEIEKRKEVKRQNARSLKEKLEETQFEIVMPAGSNGKLYGAVTPTILVETLTKNGFEIEKKRIELSGAAIKSVGNYHAVIKLYESQTAEISFNVKASITEDKSAAPKKERHAKKTDDENAKSENADDDANTDEKSADASEQ